MKYSLTAGSRLRPRAIVQVVRLPALQEDEESMASNEVDEGASVSDGDNEAMAASKISNTQNR